jgi:hypothetical protein
MWDLDDKNQYEKVLDLQLPWATTWGDRYRDRREKIREQAAPKLLKRPDGVDKWAFRISVSKSGRSRFDIENVPKQIIDAFCASQIQSDKSQYTTLGLYPDDTLDHVVILEVAGSRAVSKEETTRVEIFAVQKKA